MSAASKESALSPFKHHTFTVLWIFALISNIGTWMHSAGAGWLMTTLSPSPWIIALVQTTTTLPIFLFALPAGALADIFNRRILLLTINGFMLAAATVFAILVYFGKATSELLLLFTFLLGSGAAFMMPAWQAVMPRMVSKKDLPQAVALNGISMNLSRAIGPALAGICMSVYGMASPFIINAVSFVAILMALLWWKYQVPTTRNQTLPPERVFSAMKVGIRYALHSKPLKNTMWHAMGFMFFANAYWGLLPIISRHQLQGDAAFFGILMGVVGFGAVIGALFIPSLKTRFSANHIVAMGTVATALVTGYFSVAESQLLAVIASGCFGIGWILVLANVNVSAQLALPDWIRARGLAVFLMVLFGSMSVGSAFWGWFAGVTSIEASMLVASMGGLAFIIFSYKSELQQGKSLDFTPSKHWIDPVAYTEIHNDAGPVVIQICYEIADADREAFLAAIHELKHARMRDGAYRWSVYEDIEHKGHFIEFFMEDSWAEHLRHHERLTHADKPLQDKVKSFHKGKAPPKVSHLLAAHETRKK